MRAQVRAGIGVGLEHMGSIQSEVEVEAGGEVESKVEFKVEL